MTRQMVFLGLLIVSSLYAMIRGGRVEQIGATALLGGAALSYGLAHPVGVRFQHVEAGIFLVDIIVLGVFICLSFLSTRFWPIWIASLLLSEVIVHIARFAVPDVVPIAYLNAVALWAWAVQVILIAATWRHRDRLRKWGVDKSWRN